MKIVTWNCNGAFRRKFSELEKRLPADIYIIQECEDPNQSINIDYKSWKGYVWIGDNKNKGLGIFYNESIKVKRLKWESQDYKYFLPIRINNQFDMLGCWCHKGVTGTYNYIGQLWNYLKLNSNHLDELFVVGDFNANKIWDKKSRNWNFTNVVEILECHQIYSLYHVHENINFGVEEHPTLFLYKKKEKPYHIDYCFGSESLIEEIKMVNIGDYNDWIGLSDHMPLIASIKLTNK